MQENDVKIFARAYAAAGSDARMNGCTMPVIINSGSGNQGIAATMPVVVFAEENHNTEEEIKEYNNAVSLILANNAEINERNLTQFRIYFIEKDNYDYYNVETIIKYFMGNTTTINAGNWYHRFTFVVETSMDTVLQSIGNIQNYYTTEVVTRTAVFEWDYKRTYNDLKTKAYYSFVKPTSNTV